MTNFNRFFVSLLLATSMMAYTATTQADMQQSYGENRTYTPMTDDALQQLSYGEIVGNKALNAFANLTTSTLEMPKNIINTMNQSNFFYGVFGGFLKGLVNTLGRTGCGIADLITLPLPTRPIAYPVYIWDDFDVDTTYGEVFRLVEPRQAVQQAVIQAPVTPSAVAAPPKPAGVDRSNQYNQETNRKLDTLFKQEMQK